MGRMLHRLGTFCARHGLVVVLVWAVVAVGIGLAVSTFGAQTGNDLTLPGTGSQEDIGATDPSTTERQAYDLITAGFGVGYDGPLQVASELDVVLLFQGGWGLSLVGIHPTDSSVPIASYVPLMMSAVRSVPTHAARR